MEETNVRKSALLAILLAAALVASFLVSRKEDQSAQTAPAVTSATTTGTTEVKGASATASATTTVPLYTEAESLNHLDLTAANIIWYTNYYRVQNGRLPLVSATKLNASAAAKNQSMARYDYFDHTQPGTSNTFDTFIEAQHYDYIKVGENLAMGDFKTSYDVVNAWMNSPAHKQNILDSAYTQIGVNVLPTVRDGREVVLITQHFGKPRNSCPTIDASLKTSIQTLNTTIQGLKKDTISQSDTDAYNAVVDTYNATVSRLSTLVGEYNQQVKAFDSCVSAQK